MKIATLKITFFTEFITIIWQILINFTRFFGHYRRKRRCEAEPVTEIVRVNG